MIAALKAAATPAEKAAKDSTENSPQRSFEQKLMDWVHNSVGHGLLDISLKYIGPQDEENRPYDGLIRAPIGYYRLVANESNGHTMLLFSNDPDALTGDIHEDGIEKITDFDNIYGIAVREKMTRNTWVRTTIQEHQWTLLENALHRLNLYRIALNPETLENGTGSGATTGNDDTDVIKLTNKELAYGIFRQDDGTHSIRMYSRHTGDDDNLGEFVKVNENAPDGFAGKIFSLSTEKGTFETRSEAEEFIARDFNRRAYRIWNGESAISQDDKQDDKTLTVKQQAVKLWHYIKQPRFARGAVSAGLVAGIVSVNTMTAGIVPGLLSLAVTVPLALASDQATKAVQQIWNRAMARFDKAREVENQHIVNRERIDDYIVDSPENRNRVCPRLDPEKMGTDWRALKQDEVKAKQKDIPNTPFLSKTRAEEYILGAITSSFGGIVSFSDDCVFSFKLPNGLVALYDVEEDAVYARHRPELKEKNDIPDAPDPKVPSDVRELLGDHIIKVRIDSYGNVHGEYLDENAFAEKLQDIHSRIVEQELQPPPPADTPANEAGEDGNPDDDIEALRHAFNEKVSQNFERVSQLFNIEGGFRPQPPAPANRGQSAAARNGDRAPRPRS